MRHHPRFRPRNHAPARHRGAAVVGVLALLVAGPAAPAHAAPTGAPLQRPSHAANDNGGHYDWDDFEIPTFPDRAEDLPNYPPPLDGPEELRTGTGTGCEPPDPLPAHNAGDDSGHGYQVPFLIALTDGRMFAGHSIAAADEGQLPFMTTAFGITGWVRGYVDLPAMSVTVPDDGMFLCDRAALVTQAERSSRRWPPPRDCDDPGCGTLENIAAWPDDDAFFQTQVYEMELDGPVAIDLAGISADGALQFSAATDVHTVVGVDISGVVTDWKCQAAVSLDMRTAESPRIEQYDPIPNPYPMDDEHWEKPRGEGWHVDSKTPSFDPPQQDWLPTRGLDSATTGGTGVAGSASFVIPYYEGGPGLTCNNEQSNAQSQFLSPLDPGTGYPMWIGAAHSGNYDGPNDARPAEMAPGSGQTSIDMRIADMGVQSGLPDGFGFSS